MPRLHPWLQTRAFLLAAASLAVLLLPWPIRWLQPMHTLGWLVDLAVHWQLQAGVAFGLACGGQAVLRRRGVWLLGPVVAVGLVVWGAYPALGGADSSAGAGIKVASVNVHLDNTQPQKLLQWVAQEQPDVLMLQEVTPAMQPWLQSLREAYPHGLQQLRDDPFGLAVLSKTPLVDVQAEALPGQPPFMRTVLRHGGRDVVLYAVHPMPPISPAMLAERNELMAHIAQRTAEDAKPALVAGDFNASPWSSAFAPLQAQGLQRATGLWPTWRLLGLPIDHVVASAAHWRVLRAGVGPDVGSDHRPVWVQLVLLPS